MNEIDRQPGSEQCPRRHLFWDCKEGPTVGLPTPGRYSSLRSLLYHPDNEQNLAPCESMSGTADKCKQCPYSSESPLLE